MAENQNTLRTVQVVTVSTRAAAGEMEDRSGLALAEGLREAGLQPGSILCIPDHYLQIQQTVLRYTDFEPVALLAFSGGTGPTPDDLTTDALVPLLDRTFDGIASAIHSVGAQSTDRAVLSRTVVGARARTIVAALPGSPGGVRDALAVLTPLLAHLLQLTQGLTDPH